MNQVTPVCIARQKSVRNISRQHARKHAQQRRTEKNTTYTTHRERETHASASSGFNCTLLLQVGCANETSFFSQKFACAKRDLAILCACMLGGFVKIVHVRWRVCQRAYYHILDAKAPGQPCHRAHSMDTRAVYHRIYFTLP